MVVTDFLFALVIAFLIFVVFLHGFRWVGPFGGVLWFFLIVLFASWTGGVWVRPVGPVLWGVYWVPFVVVGLLAALLLAAASPPRPPGKPPRGVDEEDAKGRAEILGVTLSVFFWIMLIFLVLAIAVHYIMRAPA
jgi:hypothetical protein